MNHCPPATQSFDHAPAQISPVGLEIQKLELQDLDGTSLLRIAGWHMQPGVHWLYGASGSGKSRLLHCLAGSEGSHTEPSIRWHSLSTTTSTLSPNHVLLTDAEQTQWDGMTLPEVQTQLLAPHAHAHCELSAASHMRWQTELLENFGLTPHIHKTMRMLSTGTRRKVFIMAALLARHPVVLLDEPCAALDWRSIRALYKALALRNRLVHPQVLLIATAIEPQEHGQTGRAHWRLT